MRKHWMSAILLLTGAPFGPWSDRAHAQSGLPEWPAAAATTPAPYAAPAMPALPDLSAWSAAPATPPPYTARAQWDVSNNDSVPNPLPIGPDRPDQGGLYAASEFMFMTGQRAIGHQTIAVRGFVDSDGSVTGTAGAFVGSKNVALDTDSFGTTTWVPGWKMELGYKLADSSSFSVSYIHLVQAVYAVSAGPTPANFQQGVNGADAFLFAPVFGYSPQFSGPQNRLALANGTIIGSGGSPYGIWNGANTMDLKYTQRFDNWDITYRSPVLQTDYSRSWATAGGRFAWIWERLGWNTAASDYTGQQGPDDAANYVNIMSQRMYGPFVGVGNDIYLGSAWSLSGEASAGALFAIVKERVKYYLSDESTGSKYSAEQFTLVPNINASINLNWFPLSNVQVRVGYNLWSFFNTLYMDQPVAMDAGAPEPSYNHRVIRYFQGLNFGFAVSF